MKYIEYIRDNFNIDYNRNDLTVNSVRKNTNLLSVNVDLTFDNVLTLNDYNNFIKINNDLFVNKIKYNNVTININYKDDSIKSEEALLYINEVISLLVSQNKSYLLYQTLSVTFSNKCYTFKVDSDSLYLEHDSTLFKNNLKKYGLNYDVKYEIDNTIKPISQIISEKQEDNINKLKETLSNEPQNLPVQIGGSSNSKTFFKRKPKVKVDTLSKINEIPLTQDKLLEYSQNVGFPGFKIMGTIESIDISKKTENYLAKFVIADDTDSIICNKWVKEEEYKTIINWNKGDSITSIGTAEFSKYEKDIVLNVQEWTNNGKTIKKKREDKAEKKYVELMAHTKMSTLDGLNQASEYINTALSFGMTSMGFSDFDGLYYIPDILHHWPKGATFKPIYGVELAYINDLDYKVALTSDDIDLKSATYTVFDIETTGLSQRFDTIIQISCLKVRNEEVIDSFNTFVNPKRHIPENIQDLTQITDEMVKDEPVLEDIMPSFLKFMEGTVLVGHNVQFDTGMIYAKAKELGLYEKEFPAIDTANLFRAYCNPDEDKENGKKRFNLEVLAKFFKVRQDQHHRADDDTRVTEECFIKMLRDLYKRNIFNYKDLNNIINPDNFFKYVIPSKINFLALNQEGFKNMYRLVSDALTIHCHETGRAVRSVIERFRKGLLVFEGEYDSNIFELTLRRSEEEVMKEMEFLDFVCIQPPLAYNHIIKDMPEGREKVEEVLRTIVRLAKKCGKIVCASSSPHYIEPEDRKYREILIDTPLIGGGVSKLARSIGKKKDASPYAHLRTTDELLEEFSFLGEEIAYEIVVENTNKIADMVGKIQVFPEDNKETGEEAMKAPRDDQFAESLGIPSLVDDMKRIVNSNLDLYYGSKPHPIVEKRVNRELKSIIGAGYASTYYMAHLMVHESVKDGYMVGSRGSVGSSFVATMMEITEINPLPPHYRCKNCKFHVFKMSADERREYGVSELEEPFMHDLDNVLSGYDLPDAVCPCCGKPLVKDGHDIPFETFLGFNGDKVPDIDLNFSSEYQAEAHAFIKKVFGVTHSFRAGTLATVAEKTGFGYVKGYCERNNIVMRNCQIARVATKITDVKRSTGQHPGGIVVVPKYFDIFSVTPIQYPSNDTSNAWMTTHYDYHSFESNLLKLDALGHDDPTMIRYFMDYVHLHQDKFPFDKAQDIPIDDKEVYKMFNSTSVLGITEEEVSSKVASFAVPEFGTAFVRQMLNDTMPQTFAQLVKISGLSHGTNVWLNNAQALVLGTSENGKIPFADIVGCRDDIMLDLIKMGCDPSISFKIMEFIRKGKAQKDPAKWDEYKAYLREKKVPEWYIWTCNKIEYLFPKAHATAYVLMALRIAWFKMYSPALFYAGWFSKRAKGFEPEIMQKSVGEITNYINSLRKSDDKTKADDDVISCLEVAREARARGIIILPIDINLSKATLFDVVDDKTIRIPFVAVPGLGEAAAMSIENARNEAPFVSIEDISKRTKMSKTHIEYFRKANAFGNLPEKEEKEEFNLFSF